MNTLRLIPIVFLAVGAMSLATAKGGDVQVQRNEVYVERDSGPLAADVYLPAGDGPFPGLLVVHGGAWTLGTRAQLATVAEAFARQGYTAAAISYRLAPKHKFPAQLHDCQAAVRWLRQNAERLKIDPTRIGGYGYSAGGQLVALLGTLEEDVREESVSAEAPSARLQAVVAGGAPCDFRVLPPHSRRLAYWLGGTRADKPDLYLLASPAAFITSDDPPMLFFHGTNDLLVPIRSARRMVSILSSSGVTAELFAVENRGHMEALFDREALRRSLAFADRHLKSVEVEGGASDGQ
jgi:acetyl esterase/lipase